MEYYNLGPDRVLEKLKSNKEKGLSKLEISLRLKKYGLNKIQEEHKIQKLKLFINQFKSPLIYVLLAAIVILLIINRTVDALVIFAIVIVNSLLGYYQEFKSEKALLLLKKMSSPIAKVIRGNTIKTIASENLVPGDIILLETGDKVPADARIIESVNLQANESVLTGESIPVLKTIEKIPEKKEVADQKNMVFAGTIISYGHGQAVVTQTGKTTEFGKIAESLKTMKETKTPLQKKMGVFSHQLGVLILAISSIFFIVGVGLRNIPVIDSLMTSIALAVSAIPEGLPAVVTISLALGMQKMVKNKALVRKLSSIETLGSVTTICTDKTGTLTKDEMTVKQIFADNKIIHVTGSGYSTKGEFLYQKHRFDSKKINKILETALLCNNSKIKGSNVFGDSTELALLVAAKKADIHTEFKRVNELPFDSSKKYMATVDKKKNEKLVHLKGAPEIIIEKCKYYLEGDKNKTLTEKDKEKFFKINEQFASASLRVIALAYGPSEKELTFLGLMGMMDTPRENVAYSLKLAKKAGIRSIMITGDNALTAQTIAKQLGLGQNVIVGRDLNNLSEEQLRKKVTTTDIFARVNPEHKVRILKALQSNGEVVAMTGDGINDAPALKKADIGVSMGIKGTDVSKETSDMILLDDSFVTIVKAIKQGRNIYDNIKKFVKYLLSANLAEVIIISLALFLAVPLPFLPLQILWINLVTDSLPALALGVDKPEKNIMFKKPRPKKEGILKGSVSFLVLAGIFGACASLIMYFLNLDQGVTKARTLALTTLILFELLLVFVARKEKESVFSKNILENIYIPIAVLASLILHLLLIYTPLSTIFGVTSLTITDWLNIVGISILAVLPLDLKKFITKKNKYSLSKFRT